MALVGRSPIRKKTQIPRRPGYPIDFRFLICHLDSRKKARCPGEKPTCSLCHRLGQRCSYGPQASRAKNHAVSAPVHSQETQHSTNEVLMLPKIIERLYLMFGTMLNISDPRGYLELWVELCQASAHRGKTRHDGTSTPVWKKTSVSKPQDSLIGHVPNPTEKVYQGLIRYEKYRMITNSMMISTMIASRKRVLMRTSK